MSLRLYLDSAPQPRTPDGSAGEWADFFHGATELEAKSWPPLLWWAMFGTGDLLEARFADTADAGTEEHAELLSEWGDATYPYLVVDQRTAVQRLRTRKDGLISRLGTRFSPLYDEFVAFVEDRYAPYVLLRTEGLDHGNGTTGLQFAKTLADLERLDTGLDLGDGGPVESLVADFLRWRHTDPVRLLSGAGDGWPSEALKEHFARPARGVARRDGDSATTGPRWGLLVIGVCAVAAYAFTGQVWPVVVTLGAGGGVLVARAVRRRR
ncbi:hypothetical protein ACIPSE_10710 [Streptomyces sp. NPDC090106]|uniref:hypothetical protein n=1 Tax=Streptomyces sp. NPDC090106 TaxID=3365946 RepID=UPI0038272834